MGISILRLCLGQALSFGAPREDIDIGAGSPVSPKNLPARADAWVRPYRVDRVHAETACLADLTTRAPSTLPH